MFSSSPSRFALGLFAGLMLLGSGAAGARAQTAPEFARAHRMHLALMATPLGDRKPEDYQKIVDVLAPLWRDPTASQADSARYEAAGVYVDLARDLNDPAAYPLAAGELLDLLHATPFTVYRRNAEWALAQIQIFHLHQPRAAADWLRDFERRYPADPRVALAREEMAGRKIPEPAYLESTAVLPPINPPATASESGVPAPASTATPPAASPEAATAVIAPPPPEVAAPRPAPRPSPRHIVPPAPPRRASTLALHVGPLTGIHVYSNSDASSVVVGLTSAVRFARASLPRSHIVYFDLRDPRLHGLSEHRLQVNDGRIRSITVAGHPGFVRVVIDMVPAARADRGRFFPNPDRLIVGVTGGRLARLASNHPPQPLSRPVVAPPEPGARTHGAFTLARAVGLRFHTIVLDPGHGGHDTGTIGPGGLEEKTVVLDVARRLGRLLQDRLGMNVVYTRDSDVFVPLIQRTAIANCAHAGLFVSIHANASRAASAAGVETYYLNQTNDARALTVSARENAGDAAGMPATNAVLRQIAAYDKMEASRQLASDIQASLAGASGEDDRGVKSAPFVVLIGARMPSVLAEISFLSHPVDARKLRTAAYREKLAEALYAGILDFARSRRGSAEARLRALPPQSLNAGMSVQ